MITQSQWDAKKSIFGMISPVMQVCNRLLANSGFPSPRYSDIIGAFEAEGMYFLQMSSKGGCIHEESGNGAGAGQEKKSQ